MIKFHCGACGAPLDEEHNHVEVPENYNPKDYPDTWCNDCWAEECQREENSRMVQVTREMAIDAGDKSLEGQWVRW